MRDALIQAVYEALMSLAPDERAALLASVLEREDAT